MKFAVVGEGRRKAQRGLPGKCPLCGNAMIPKCGDIRVPHWAHLVKRTCDHWWEPETEWHRAWKNHFPKAWQEIIHQSDDGEKHIADVKTESEVVIEFQHSHLAREERESRENFYPKIVWVVFVVRADGRKVDLHFRNMTNKVIHGDEYKWQLGGDDPKIIVHSNELERWRLAEISVLRLMSVIGGLMF